MPDTTTPAPNGASAREDYAAFLADKALVAPPCGFRADPSTLPAALFPFQRDSVLWALARGRACLFHDCGLGKTAQQLAWADAVARHTGHPVLILTPLAVAQQTVREAAKFGIEDVRHCESGDNAAGARIVVTNYEKLHRFDVGEFGGVVLDESSILKAYDGKTRTMILEAFADTPYRLACTATPAPNDHMELANHAEFVGAMTRQEMLASFFVHDGSTTQAWRIKGHAEQDFWRWVASWACVMRKPSDIGYDDTGFALPPLHYHHHIVDCPPPPDRLFSIEALTLADRRGARRASMDARVADIAQRVNATDAPCIVWCDLNAESQALTRAIAGAVEVTGSDAEEVKERALVGFGAGDFRVLVTKPSIAGFGMNWQHCAHVEFAGLSDSYEQFYQAIRRCWRFGQARDVAVHITTSDAEGAVVANIQRKDTDAERMYTGMVRHVAEFVRTNIRTGGTTRMTSDYRTSVESGAMWDMRLGDCIEEVKALPDDSVAYSVFSPPFASLYTYSNSDRDMGNCANEEAFAEHFRYLVKDLHRVTQPGRLLSFHCMNLPTSKVRDGYIGIRDFRGHLIRMFEDAGFVFHSEVCIWKDPVTAMQRTKAIGLLHKQVCKDSALSRQGVPDYLVTMRKLGDNAHPVAGNLVQKYTDAGLDAKAIARELGAITGKDLSIDLWQRYASPVWMDIRATRTLQGASAREDADERHICPLQLDVIERCVLLWSNPGDLVLSPFAGIGSEGVVSVEMGRRFLGVELKESYWRQAVANLRATDARRRVATLFDDDDLRGDLDEEE